jgi:hypothetical protein
MMQKALKIIAITLISLNVNCQTLPLNGPEEPNNGGYLKDIENVLPFWEGTWKGTVNNKEYTFQFVQFPHHLWSFPNGDFYYIDRLMVKFKVEDLTNNQILYDDLNVVNFEDYKVEFLSYNIYNGYSFFFSDSITNCFNSAEFKLIKNPNNPNQVLYTAFNYDALIHPQSCPYANQQDIPMFLPKVDLTLTRQ